MEEDDPCDSILAEAGAISLSQEEILRRSRFIRPAPAPSSSSPSSSSSSSSSSSYSSGDGEGGDAAAHYRISLRPVIMRSASDSHHSSSSSRSSSDARSGGGGKVARPLGVEERPDVGDGGRGWSGLPGKGGDRLLGGMGEKKSCASKRKLSPEEEEQAAARSGKKLRAFSDESAQEPGDSSVPSPAGKLVAKRLRFSGSGKEAASPARRDGDPQVSRSVVRCERRDRSADDEFAQFRYVRTGAPSLCHSPPELLKGAHGPPKSARGGARSAPQQRSRVAAIKSVSIGRPQEIGKGVKGLQRPSPCIRDMADGERDRGSGASAGSHRPLPPEAGPNALVQLRNPGQPEVEISTGTGLGTTSPVEIPMQLEGQRHVERAPSGGAQSPESPTKSAPGGGAEAIKGPSDLVDLLLKFSRKPDKRLENVDFLDVLAMKGIHIPPPSWWRPGGYSSERKKT